MDVLLQENEMNAFETDHPWRGNLYALMGLIYYREPALDFMQDLAEKDLFSFSPPAERNEEVIQGFRILSRTLHPLHKGTEKDLENLQADYFQLFIGAGMPLAPPWESYYRTEERIMFSEYTLEVRAQYERFGLISENRGKEPEDHIGLELEFMACLCDRAFHLLRKGDTRGAAVIFENQKRFLDEHLLQWVPGFCRDVRRYAETDFYAGMARLTQGFLTWDRLFLEENNGDFI